MRWHSDPGHEWLEVSPDKLKGYRPTGYSYYHPETGIVFLEGDCDVERWLSKSESLVPVTSSPELEHEDFRAFCRLNGIYRIDSWKGQEREWILDKIEGKQVTHKYCGIVDERD